MQCDSQDKHFFLRISDFSFVNKCIIVSNSLLQRNNVFTIVKKKTDSPFGTTVGWFCCWLWHSKPTKTPKTATTRTSRRLYMKSGRLCLTSSRTRCGKKKLHRRSGQQQLYQSSNADVDGQVKVEDRNFCFVLGRCRPYFFRL